MHPACRQEVAKVMGREVTDGEARNLELRIKNGMRQLAAQDPAAWGALTSAEKLKQGAQFAAKQLIAVANKRKERAELAIQANDRLTSQIDTMVKSGVSKDKLDALSRLLAPVGDGRTGISSLDESIQGIKTVYGGMAAGGLELTKGKAFGFARDVQAEVQLVKALWRDKDVTPEFSKGADEIHAVFDAMKDRMNRAGGMIGTLENYDMPHAWSTDAIIKSAGKEDPVKFFADQMLPRMKRSEYRTPEGAMLNDQELHKFLIEAATSILTDGANKRLDAKAVIGKPGGGIKANRGSKERQIHLSDSAAYLDAMKQFSETPVQAAVYNHITQMARDIALIETLGPNPDVTVSHLAGQFHDEKVVENVGDTKKKTEAEIQVRSIENLYNELSGNSGSTPNTKVSKFFGAYRNLKYSATLGGTALLAGPTDSASAHLVAQGIGLSSAKLFKNQLKAFTHTDEAMRDGARRSGIAFQAFGEDMVRWGGEVGHPGVTSVIASTVIRATGLNYVTNANRNAFSATMFDGIGHLTRDHANLADIKEGDGKFISRSGITQQDWTLMRAAEVEDWGGGDRILTPQAVMAVKDADVAAAIGSTDPGAIIAAREGAATRYAGFVSREMNSAVITPGSREKAAMNAFINKKAASGSVINECIRSFLMFKSFAFAAFNKLILRTGAYEGSGAKARYLASMIAMTTIGGAAGITLRGMASGRDPSQMVPTEDSKKPAFDFYLRAVLAGGGLGLYGDLLTTAVQKPFGGVLGSLAGPFADDISNASGVAASALGLASTGFEDGDAEQGADKVALAVNRLIRGITPGSNLWYTKAATDHLIYNQLQEALSPGSLARSQSKSRQNGTTFWWAPTEAAPTRAPSLSAILGQ
ncbi:hypothetical protein ACYZT4_10940 [Pseudomonas sp. GB2N2]